MTPIIRSRPELAERNLRTVVRYGPPHVVQVYGQDLVDLLGELDRLRQQAEPVLERVDQALAAGVGRG